MRTVFKAMVVTALVCSLAGLSGLRVAAVPSGGAAGTASVSIVDFGFEAPEVTVPAGSTITWTNTGERPHTVTDRGGTFDSGPLPPGATTGITLDAPGRYSYFCRINPGTMNATVVVEPGAEPSATNRIQMVDDGNIEGETRRFDPPQISAPPGSTLIVANVGGQRHTLTADEGAFTTPVVEPGPEAGRFAGTNAELTVPEDPGTYPFHCEIHPVMTGVLTVTGQQVEAAPTGEPPPQEAPPDEAPAEGEVVASDFAFSPLELAVAPGATVTVDNAGEAPHTLTLDDRPIDTGQIAPGESATVTAPDEPGTYSYRCTIHPARMRAALVVVGEAGAGGDSGTDDEVTLDEEDEDTGAATEGAAPAAADDDSDGISTLAIVTGILAVLVAGIGIAAFVMRRKGTGAGPPAP